MVADVAVREQAFGLLEMVATLLRELGAKSIASIHETFKKAEGNGLSVSQWLIQVTDTLLTLDIEEDEEDKKLREEATNSVLVAMCQLMPLDPKATFAFLFEVILSVNNDATRCTKLQSVALEGLSNLASTPDAVQVSDRLVVLTNSYISVLQKIPLHTRD